MKDLQELFDRCDEVSAEAARIIKSNRRFVLETNLMVLVDWFMDFLFWAQWRPLNPTLH